MTTTIDYRAMWHNAYSFARQHRNADSGTRAKHVRFAMAVVAGEYGFGASYRWHADRMLDMAHGETVTSIGLATRVNDLTCVGIMRRNGAIKDARALLAFNVRNRSTFTAILA